MDNTLKKLLIKHEGIRDKPYRDNSKKIGFEGKPGKLTIGVGRNLEDEGLSPEEIDFLLDNDIRRKKIEVFSVLPWVFKLDDLRQVVILSMAFNMGVDGLLEFKKMLGAVETGDFKTAAHEMIDSVWALQVGSRATYLSKIMETGQL